MMPRRKNNHENNVCVPSSLCPRGAGKGGENDNDHRSLDAIFYFSQEQQHEQCHLPI